MDTIQIPCLICNNTKTRLKFVKSGMNIRCCEKCQLVFVYPQPSIETQQEYYDKSFREGGYKLYSISKDLRIRLNQRRFKEISRYNPKGKILDIGCANGFFLDIASEQGLSTYGVELSSEAAKKAKEKHSNIFNGILENAKYSDSFFDIITLFDLIEHVLNPNSTIKEISRIIKPGGLIVITTPNISSWHAKLMEKRWGLITPLEHLFYFSPSSIKFLLEKNGFTLLEIRKNYKVFTLDYLFKMAEFFYPNLFKILSFVKYLLPKNFLLKEREFYIGEIFVVAKKL